MKILILGDSFCGVNDNDSWMQQLKKITGATVDCYGLNGCSNWFIYENFLKYVDASYDYIFIIMLYTFNYSHYSYSLNQLYSLLIFYYYCEDEEKDERRRSEIRSQLLNTFYSLIKFELILNVHFLISLLRIFDRLIMLH